MMTQQVYVSRLTKEMGVCRDWPGLMGFVLIRKRDDGTKYCNQACCTVKTCECHLFPDMEAP